MRKLAALLLAAGVVLSPGAAFADHDWGGGGGYRDNDGRECRGGGCGNEREETYEGSGCKYFCPEGRFDDSPVQDSFNICLPGATCNFDRQPEEEQQPQ